MITHDEAITKLIELVSTLPRLDRTKALDLLQGLEAFQKKQEASIELLYNNVVVLHNLIGVARPLN